jgi:mono/diheme cytochrome c family protein
MKRITKFNKILSAIIVFIVLVLIQSCKHEPFINTSSEGPVATPTPGTIHSQNGDTLYENNCAGCHGPLLTSAKLGSTVAQIQTGINTIGVMRPLSVLTSAQIQAIADALKAGTTLPPVTDGATLYANYCASCHGPLATSAKIGATSARIQNAVSTISQMNSLTTLTSTQIQAIATALQALPMPTDGPTLYSINCASCHGALANSRVGGASVSDIQQAIRQKNQMKYLSILTTAQIQAIAGALANIRGGND